VPVVLDVGRAAATLDVTEGAVPQSHFGFTDASTTATDLHMKQSADLLATLKDISKRIEALTSDPGRHDLDPDAIVDLNLARQSVDKLVNRVQRLVE
jgi:hypothetical protein